MALDIHILVVDDEPNIRKACTRVLSEEGYRITAAEDGRQALDLIKDNDFDLVLLDLMMPGIDGLEVLRRLNDLKPDTDVIIITGFATVGKAVEAMKLGAVNFIPKPFTPDHLRMVVRQSLNAKNLEMDVSRLRSSAEKSRLETATEQSRMKAVFRCMEEGVLVTDCDLVVLLHNPAAENLLDFQCENIDGKNLQECVKNDPLVETVRKAIDEGASSSLEFPPGSISSRSLKAHCSPVFTGEEGGLIGSVTVFEDITTLKKLDAIKSEFVSKVSHELKTPLGAVKQLVHMLKDGRAGDVPDNQMEILDRIFVRIGEMTDLINNLLNISKLETGTLVFNMEPVFIGPLMAGCVDTFSVTAKSKNIKLTLILDDDLPQVMADKKNIDIAFKNLVGNAVKYTPEGGEVTVGVHRQGDSVVAVIRDTGIGIPEQDLPKIFDKFHRVKDEHTRWIPGSGLGLSITRQIVETHQGRIEVESTYGEGTIFRVILPALP